MKKIIVGLLAVMLLLAGPVLAAGMWPEGWSHPQDMGQTSYDSRRMEYPQIRFQDNILSMGYDSRTEELTITVLNLTEQEIDSRLVLQSGNMSSYDLAAGQDCLYVVWAVQNGTQREIYYLELDQKFAPIGEPALFHLTSSPLGRVMIAPGPASTHIIWNELTSAGFALFSQEIGGAAAPVEFTSLGTPAEPHRLIVEESGKVHLLWNKSDQVLQTRTLNYALLSPAMEVVSNTELGNTSFQEHSSGSMDLYHGTVHVAWTQVIRGSFGGRNPVTTRYQTFVDGKAAMEPQWIAEHRTTQPALAIGPDGTVKVAWTESLGDNSGLEVFIGTIGDDLKIKDIQRLTYATHQFIMPTVFIWQEHDYVLYQQITGSYRVLQILNNQFPDAPSTWRRLGLDANNVVGSLLYKVGQAFVLSGLYAILSSIPVIVATSMIYLIHKFYGPPKSRFAFLLQMGLVCSLIFFQLSAFNFVTLQPVHVTGIYQIFLFVAISAFVLFLFNSLRGNKDEPFIYGGAGFIWLFFWFFLTSLTQVPFVIS